MPRRNAWPFVPCKTRRAYRLVDAYKSCATYSLRLAPRLVCLGPTERVDDALYLLRRTPHWEAFAHRGVQATDRGLAGRGPKTAFTPPHPLERLLSHTHS
jgi:hypothetical protein